MRKAAWATCIWPGLAQLWIAGLPAGLALAVGFALLVNLLLASTLVWDEMAGPMVARGAWGAVCAFWAVSSVLSCRWLAQYRRQLATPAEADLYPLALNEYLRGDWYRAESLCRERLRQIPADADTLLLLSGVLRRAGRPTEAAGQLARLEQLEAAEKWRAEIEAEKELLAASRAHQIESDSVVITATKPEPKAPGSVAQAA